LNEDEDKAATKEPDKVTDKVFPGNASGGGGGEEKRPKKFCPMVSNGVRAIQTEEGNGAAKNFHFLLAPDGSG